MNKKKLVLIGTSACLALFLSVGIAGANLNNVLQKHLSGDEVVLQNNIKKLSVEQLINEIESVAATVGNPSTFAKNSNAGANDINTLIPFVSELFERKDQIPDKDILKVVSDDTKSVITREALVDLYVLKHEGNKGGEELKQILLQDEINSQVKSRIVATTDFTSDDVGLLKEIIQQDDDILAFNGLKRLSNINVSEAYEISKNILSNVQEQSSNRISAALRATAKYLHNSGHTNLQKNSSNLEGSFIETSFNIMKSSNDEVLKDSAVFAISEVGSQNAITQIINSDLIEKELKAFAIDQNFIVLKEMLTENPTKEDIEIVVSALEILPITDLVEPLTELIPHIGDVELKKRIDKVIVLAKEEGISANHKWDK
ncbi:hypothetical protein M3629_19015 [Paenibacillus polysaccharolyticus]|uniref:hypothetical protein n=1 Tax=Paenibacillus polysaccharolyticus TaxID=582692 RepID=UPI00203E1CD1|nr:hypothetical protein [Paenibacillus polysaccharolyticus]MCM3134874.1 hypothetical protein [Paenibacillus polysaccharolyticus]